MRKEPADYEAIKLIKSSVSVPVFANGGCKTYEEALKIAELTKADGIMVAEALLDNPSLFAGYNKTPIQCLKDWVSFASLIHQLFFHFSLKFAMN